MEPCKSVMLVEAARLEVDEEDEALAMAMVVGQMAVVPLRVGNVRNVGASRDENSSQI